MSKLNLPPRAKTNIEKLTDGIWEISVKYYEKHIWEKIYLKMKGKVGQLIKN